MSDAQQYADALGPTLPGAFTGTPSERISRQIESMRKQLESAEASDAARSQEGKG